MQPSPGTWVSLSAHIAQTTEWRWLQLLHSLPLAVPVTVVMPLTTAGVGALHWVAERVWLPEGLDWPRRNFSPREILTPCAGALRQHQGFASWWPIFHTGERMPLLAFFPFDISAIHVHSSHWCAGLASYYMLWQLRGNEWALHFFP